MSDEDIARIRTRTAKVRISEDDNASSVYQDTVEPKDKGKTTDPRNWGNVKLDEPEINPGIQQAMLTHFIAARDAEHFANSRTELPKDKPRTTRRTAWVEEVEDDEDPRIVRPIATRSSNWAYCEREEPHFRAYRTQNFITSTHVQSGYEKAGSEILRPLWRGWNHLGHRP
ncbi:hypothetical protein DFH05DRAFT_1501419 [Lentinula detonsa]|uniref:Uncharacterized protein n=1 Tax=Lentinula detonsa TaxID=2804962 RepID=A0A9W8TW75_9AGAR|nr:hypothetical protein DFH05DRAFT_1501419 [Lentinula detonsa]